MKNVFLEILRPNYFSSVFFFFFLLKWVLYLVPVSPFLFETDYFGFIKTPFGTTTWGQGKHRCPLTLRSPPQHSVLDVATECLVTVSGCSLWYHLKRFNAFPKHPAAF